ncbi:MAG: SDR family oxidoreductase [Ilumatobacteraceae bacterium]
MELGLHGRRALVTGASSGLGLSTALALAAEGAEVMIVARSEERLAGASSSLQSQVPGAIVHTHIADVSEPGAVTSMATAAVATMGGVDILIANAGGPPPGGFASTPLEAYLPALQLNLLSTVAMCDALVPAMQTQGWGRVVAITSITVREPNPNLILSNMARAGLTGFLRTLAREVAADGVTVNSVQPGLHRTARLEALHTDVDAVAASVPTRTIGDPDDFGRVAAFLCSDSARFITGSAIPVDGGASHGLQ